MKTISLFSAVILFFLSGVIYAQTEIVFSDDFENVAAVHWPDSTQYADPVAQVGDWTAFQRYSAAGLPGPQFIQVSANTVPGPAGDGANFLTLYREGDYDTRAFAGWSRALDASEIIVIAFDYFIPSSVPDFSGGHFGPQEPGMGTELGRVLGDTFVYHSEFGDSGGWRVRRGPVYLPDVFAADTWHSVHYAIDLAAQTYDLTISGITYKDLVFNEGADSLGQMWFGCASAGTVYHLDNVRVTAGRDSIPIGNLVDADFELPAYVNRSVARLIYKYTDSHTGNIALTLSVVAIDSGQIAKEVCFIAEPNEETQQLQIPIDTLPAGEYVAYLNFSDAPKEEGLERYLRIDTIVPPEEPAGPINVSEMTMLFYDDWYIQESENAVRRFWPAEIFPIVSGALEEDRIRHGAERLVVRPDGALRATIWNQDRQSTDPRHYFAFISEDNGETWRLEDAAEKKEYYNEGFERHQACTWPCDPDVGFDPDSLYLQWMTTRDPYNSIAVIDDPVPGTLEGSHYLRMEKTKPDGVSGAGAVSAQIVLSEPLDKEVSVSFAFMHPVGEMLVTLYNTQSPPENWNAIQLGFGPTGAVRYRSNGLEAFTGLQYSRNEWHQVRIDANFETDTYDLSLNGVNVGGLPFVSPQTSFDRIRFGNHGAAVPALVYLDRIKIEVGNPGDVIQMKADITGDGRVNLQDIAAFAASWLKNNIDP